MRTDRTVRRFAVLAAGAVLVASPLAACGDDDDDTTTTTAAGSDTTEAATEDLKIENVWARAGTAGGNTAIYMDVTAGKDSEELIAASVPTDVAAKAELHETTGGGMDDASTTTMSEGDMSEGDMSEGDMSDGGMADDSGDEGDKMMTMKQVEKIEIPADSTVELEPGGLHVMLFDLAKDLVPGDSVELTLSFANAGEMKLTAEVKEA